MAADTGYLAAFGGGMVSFLSPCVLPLVPGYLSLMSGVGVAELQQPGPTHTARILRSTLLFVAGFTVVFTALGAGASAIGQVLTRHQRGLDQLAGVVVIVMGLLLAGFVSPRPLLAEKRLHVSPSRLGAWAPPVMGMAFAFGWTPCIGPILAGVLALAANQHTLAHGVALLIAYSLGLGVPFVVTGVAFGSLTGAFGWVKRHFRVLNLVAGLLLVGFGLLLVTNRVNWLSGQISDVMRRLHLTSLTKI